YPCRCRRIVRLHKHLQTHDGKTDLLFINSRGRPYSANKAYCTCIFPTYLDLEARITAEFLPGISPAQSRTSSKRAFCRLLNRAAFNETSSTPRAHSSATRFASLAPLALDPIERSRRSSTS